MSNYGPLAEIVAIAGNLGAAGVALRVAWAGKVSSWEPEIEELPSAPTRVAGVFSIVAIASLYVITRPESNFEWLLWLAGWLAASTLLSFLCYLFLVKTRVFECRGTKTKYIRGFRLTPAAQSVLAGNSENLLPGQPPPHNDKDFFCGSGKQADRVWTDDSIAMVHIVLVLAYIVFIASGTIAISSSSIAIEKALSG